MPALLNAHRDRGQTTAIAAHVTAEGCSGVRHVRIRDFHVLSDNGPDCSGFDLGPTSAELQLGVIGSCLTRTYLDHAAARGIPVARIEIEVTGETDPRAGQPGAEPLASLDAIRYVARLASPASDDDLAALHEAVARCCPTLRLLQGTAAVRGVTRRSGSAVGVPG